MKNGFLKKCIAAIILVIAVMTQYIGAFAVESINDYIINTDSEYLSLSNGGALNDLTTFTSKLGVKALKFYDFGKDGFIRVKPYIYTGGKYRVKFYNFLRDDGVDIKIRAWANGKNDTDTPVAEVSCSQLLGVEEESWKDLGVIDIPGGNTFEFTVEPDNHGNTGMDFKGKTLFFTQMILEQVEITEKSQAVKIPEEAKPGVEKEIALPKKNVERPSAKANAYKIYVKAGSNGDGSEHNPFGTVEEAQKKAREISAAGYPKDGIDVIIDDGTYYFETGLNFTAEDNGTDNAPVFYEAKEGANPVFIGAKEVSNSLIKDLPENVKANFNPDYADKIKYFNLSDVGIPNQIHSKEGIPLNIIDNGYTVARYPNVGYTGKVSIAGSISSMTPSNRLAEGYTYRLDIPHTANYNKELTEANVRLHGVMAVQWDVDTDVKVENFSNQAMTVMTKLGTGSSYHLDVEPSIYIYNAVEEIDTPGEYVIDYTTQRVYIYPKDDNGVHITTNKKTLINFGDNCKNMVFKNITAKYNNGDIVRTAGGNNPASFIKIIGCKFSNSTVINAAVNLGGEDNAVFDCDINDITGGLGVYMTGSTQKWSNSLLPCNHIAENNLIYNCTRGISVGWANGCTIRNNYVYHTEMTPIQFIGLSTLVEYNLIENGAYASDDVGGIYSYIGFAGSDNVVRYNIVNEVLGRKETSSRGIYADDDSSGIDIYGNIVINPRGGAFTLSGDYDTVENNIVYLSNDTPSRALYGKWFSRELKYSDKKIEDIRNVYNSILEAAGEDRLKTMYPRLYRFLSETTTDDNVNIHNAFRNNACFNATDVGIAVDSINAENSKKSAFKFWENNEYFDDLFDVHDLSTIDFDKIREKIPDFKDIPINDIGIYTGGERTTETRTHVYTKPQTTTVFAPANGDKLLNTTVNFSWEDKMPDGAAEYNLYISENESFDENVRKYTTQTNNFTLEVMPGKTYYWFVETLTKLYGDRAINKSGIQSFTTNTIEGMVEEEYMKYHFLVTDSTVGDASGNFSSADRNAAMEKDAEFKSKIDDENFIKTEAFYKEIKSAYDDYIKKEILPNERIQFYDDFSFDEIGFMPNGLKREGESQRAGYEVVYDEDNALNSVLKIEDTNYAYRGMTGSIGKFFNPNDSIDLSVDLKVSTAKVFSIRVGYIYTPALAVEFRNGMIYADSERKYPLFAYENDVWYTVRIAANIRNNTYDVYINGDLAASGVPMLAVTELGTVSTFNSVYFTTSDVNKTMDQDTGISYIDNIILKTSSTADRVNNYPKMITVNSKPLEGFDPAVTVYNLSMTKQEIDNSVVNANTSDGETKTFVVNGQYAKYIVIKSKGNKINVYRLVANK